MTARLIADQLTEASAKAWADLEDAKLKARHTAIPASWINPAQLDTDADQEALARLEAAKKLHKLLLARVEKARVDTMLEEAGIVFPGRREAGERQRFWNLCLWRCANRKLGMAAHLYHAKFKVWPWKSRLENLPRRGQWQCKTNDVFPWIKSAIVEASPPVSPAAADPTSTESEASPAPQK